MSCSTAVRVTLLLLTTCAQARASAGGAVECPCLRSTSPQFAGVATAATSKGLPSDYGQAGCRAYDDKGLSAPDAGIDCGANAKDYCTHAWCYVDMQVCLENRTECEAAGGTLGSLEHPSCRSRSADRTQLLRGTSGSELHYSYATCHSVNAFIPQTVSAIAGRTVQVAMQAEAFPPYHYPRDPFEVDSKRPHWKGYAGALVDVVEVMCVCVDVDSPERRACMCVCVCVCVCVYLCMHATHNTCTHR